MTVDADRQNLSAILTLCMQKAFQLAELMDAVGSPMAPVKDQDDVLFAAKNR